MRSLIACILGALAAGCATPSDVVKTGTNAYRIRSTAGGSGLGDADFKALGMARANEFCAAEGKHAVITIGQSSDWFVYGGRTTEVRFYCDELPR